MDSIRLTCSIFLLWITCHLSVLAIDYSDHPGHLKPIGTGFPKLDIDFYHGFPPLKTFVEDYLKKNKPLLMKGAAKSYPAYQKWSDDYFLTTPESASANISIEQRKKENRNVQPKESSLKDFILRYNNTSEYMVDKVPGAFQKDVYLPSCIHCDLFRFYDNVMWYSSGGTKSVLHSDSLENINCLIRGRKELIMINSSYPSKEIIDVASEAYSKVDVERVDLNAYPRLANVSYQRASMEPGDCLYIPYLWYHHVESFNHNIAVNIWIEKAENGLDFSPCYGVELSNVTLNGVKFSNTGLDDYDEEEEESVGLQDYFIGILKKAKKIDLATLIKELKRSTAGQNQDLSKIEKVSKQLFEILDSNKDDEISYDELDNISEKNQNIAVNLTMSLFPEGEYNELEKNNDEANQQGKETSDSNNDIKEDNPSNHEEL